MVAVSIGWVGSVWWESAAPTTSSAPYQSIGHHVKVTTGYDHCISQNKRLNEVADNKHNQKNYITASEKRNCMLKQRFLRNNIISKICTKE